MASISAVPPTSVTPNDTLRAARLAHHWGQAELAAAINMIGAAAGEQLRCEVRQVAKWEAGTVTWPQGRYRRALEAVFGVPCHTLGFVEPNYKRAPARNSSSTVSEFALEAQEDDVHRRMFMSSTLGLVGLGVTGLPSFFQADHDPTAAHYIEQMESTLHHIGGLERQFGSGQLLPMIDRQLIDVEARLKARDADSGVKSVAAKAYALGGWMHYDAGVHDRSHALCKEAMFLGQMAGDRVVTTMVANTLSMQALDLNRPREAVQYARLGATYLAAQGPISALLAMREARGWARLGIRQEANAAIRRARTALAASGPQPEWVKFFTEGEFNGALGRVSEELADWDQAEQAAWDTLTDSALPPRAHASFRASLVRILVSRGDYGAARQQAEVLLPTLAVVSSNRVRFAVKSVVEAIPHGRGDLAEVRQQLLAYA